MTFLTAFAYWTEELTPRLAPHTRSHHRWDGWVRYMHRHQSRAVAR